MLLFKGTRRGAFRAACWYMKVRLGLAGDALKNQYAQLSSPASDELYATTRFYKPVHDFVQRLDPLLLTIDNFRDFREGLRDAVYAELTTMWENCTHAPICHVIHPVWTEISWTRLILSRQTSSWYHQIAVGRGKFSDRYKYARDTVGRHLNCRFGCSSVDSLYHYIFDCKFCTHDISDLRMICRKKNLSYDFQTLFTHSCLQNRVELFLKKIFCN